MNLRLLVAVVAGLLTFLVLVFWRDFLWQLALMVALGVAALTFTALGTAERLKTIYRR